MFDIIGITADGGTEENEYEAGEEIAAS